MCVIVFHWKTGVEQRFLKRNLIKASIKGMCLKDVDIICSGI